MASLDEELANTLNSLGNLKKEQKRYEEAEALYNRSLTLRRERTEANEEQSKAKQQACALETSAATRRVGAAAVKRTSRREAK